MNPPVIRFHQIHGEDVLLYDDHFKANRIETKSNGLVFTSKSIKPNEKIGIKFVRVSSELPEIIRIGFTSRDPSTMRNQIPNSRDVKTKEKFWFCSLSREICTENKTLFFYVTSFGQIYYGLDEEERGTFDVKVDTQQVLWAVIDILEPDTTIQIVTITPKNLLHPKCSSNATISQNIIKKISWNWHDCCAFTSRPIKFNERVVVKILSPGNLIFGVTSSNPDHMREMKVPTNSTNWTVVKELHWNFNLYDELSYIIRENNVMEIRKNGSTVLKNVTVQCTSPMWGFFSLGTTKSVEIWMSTITIKANDECPSGPSASRETVEVQNPDNPDCCICVEKPKDTALYPCGHMCVCFDCAQILWRGRGDGRCPICRRSIEDVLKIYR